MKRLVTIVALVLITAATAGMIVFIWQGEQPGKLSAAESAVVINEAMSGNKGAVLDDTGSSSDWVELYNPSDEAVSLKRFSLSDDEGEPDMWEFPDVALEPHGYMVVYLSGKSRKHGDSLHVSFKLSAKGERLILSAAGNIVDFVTLPEMPDNASYARRDGKWQTTDSPTPGTANGA